MTIMTNNLEVLAWSPGIWEVVVVLVVVLLLFGGKKLPELARGLARGLKAFKHEMKDVKNELTNDPDEGKADTKDTNDETPTDKNAQ